MNKGTSKRAKAQEGRELENRCWGFLKPLLAELHRKVDRRLVKTLLDPIIVILMHHNRSSGLLLSELGGSIGRRGQMTRGGQTDCESGSLRELEKYAGRELSMQTNG